MCCHDGVTAQMDHMGTAAEAADLRQLGVDQIEMSSVVLQIHAILCDHALIHQVAQLRLISQ